MAARLVGIIGFTGISSPRVVHSLVEAGADTTSAVSLTDSETGELLFRGTPLALTNSFLCQEVELEITDAQLRRLEAVRRLLVKAALNAVSWLWKNDVPPNLHAAAGGKGEAKAPSTPLTLMLPTLRRRARRTKVLLAALFRWVRFGSVFFPIPLPVVYFFVAGAFFVYFVE